MQAEVLSSFALLVPAAFAATHAPSNALAGAHAVAIGLSALLSIVYWTTDDRGALHLDRVAARVRAAIDVAALSIALTRDIRRGMLPLGLALLALGLYHASVVTHHDNGDARLVSLFHTTFHVIGLMGEIALIGAAYALASRP